MYFIKETYFMPILFFSHRIARSRFDPGSVSGCSWLLFSVPIRPSAFHCCPEICIRFNGTWRSSIVRSWKSYVTTRCTIVYHVIVRTSLIRWYRKKIPRAVYSHNPCNSYFIIAILPARISCKKYTFSFSFINLCTRLHNLSQNPRHFI